MKKLLTSQMQALLMLLPLLFFVLAKPAYAITDPLTVPNNKFGIHIHDANDLIDASNLVNSSGGDWGYVTLVIRDDERNLAQWQEVFNKMRRMHLIPIVRIASRMGNANWQKADTDQTDDWIAFLKSLSWPTKNRYIIVGNEPNHATEWGGNVNPEEYSDYLLSFSKELKRASSDFFIMPAGLDASAPSDSEHMDEATYLERMIKKNPKLFDAIDGWSSHSYPNPGFAGSVDDTGRGSIRTYEWEMEYLKSLGVTKNLPVFITETGWVHNGDGEVSNIRRQGDMIDRYTKAFTAIWNSPNIVAVTPFIMNYTNPPFDTFSWKKKDGTFYDFYYEIQKLSKVRGEPKQDNNGEIQTVLLPEVIEVEGKHFGIAYVKNTGQKIWKVGIAETVLVEDGTMEINSTNPLSDLEPGQIGPVLYRTLTNKKQSMQNSLEFDKMLLSFLNPYIN
jgi:hypothetical protein